MIAFAARLKFRVSSSTTAGVSAGIESASRKKPPRVHADLLYLCSPNNPTGAVATKAQLERWVAWAREHEAVILFDAAYEGYISDPSLPPEKYHARCGGADCRTSSERGAVRKSLAKRRYDSTQRATMRRSFQLGTVVANVLKKIGIKQKSSCGCGRREKTLNRWGRSVIRMFRFW